MDFGGFTLKNPGTHDLSTVLEIRSMSTGVIPDVYWLIPVPSIKKVFNVCKFQPKGNWTLLVNMSLLLVLLYWTPVSRLRSTSRSQK